jgi:hypothetical protein
MPLLPLTPQSCGSPEPAAPTGPATPSDGCPGSRPRNARAAPGDRWPRRPAHGPENRPRCVWDRPRGPALARHHIPTKEERARPRAAVRKLPALALPRGHRQPRMCALQGVPARQCVCPDDPLALLRPRGGVAVERADVCDCGGTVGRVGRRQPIAPAMRLPRPWLNSRAAWRGDLWATIWRCVISAALSRAVHWRRGRPVWAGVAPASAPLWPTGWSVMRTGLPGRGASVRRAAPPRWSRATAGPPRHRGCQRRPVASGTPSWRAIWRWLAPWAAA